MKSKFKKELKRQVRMAFAAAIGFIIAYAWRDFILKLVEGTLENFVSKPLSMSFFIALLITFIGVILILISSRLLE